MTDFLPIANAGTPLMWLGCCWLVFGNLLIGVLESKLLVRRWQSRNVQFDEGHVILGNYASASIGVILVLLAMPIGEWVLDRPTSRGLPFLLLSWLLAFLISVVIEAPFINRAIIPRPPRRWLSRESFAESLVLQAASYAILFPLTFIYSGYSALRLKEISLGEMNATPGWVYFIHPDGKSAMRIRTDGRDRQWVKPLPSDGAGTFKRLVVDRDESDKYARLVFFGSRDPVEIHGKLGPAPSAALRRKSRKDGFAHLGGNTTFGFGSIPTFREHGSEIKVGFFAVEGIVVDGADFRLETPFINLFWRSANELPDGKIVVAMGPNIVILDAKNEQVAYLVRGSGPGVQIDLPKKATDR